MSLCDTAPERTDKERMDWLQQETTDRWLQYGGCYINGDLRAWIDEQMENEAKH